MKGTENLIDGKSILQKTIHVCSNYKNVIRNYSIAIIKFFQDDIRNTNTAAEISTNRKTKAFKVVGFDVDIIGLSEACDTSNFVKLISTLNNNSRIIAVIIQQPIPHHLKTFSNLLASTKNIDGQGSTSSYDSSAVAEATFRVLQAMNKFGKSIYLIGAKGFVGENVSKLLTNNKITIHPLDKEDNFSQLKNADIIITCMGKPNLLDKNNLRSKQCIIDIGFTKYKDRFVGDVNTDFYPYLRYVTPVPNGMGPLNIATLLERIFIQCLQIHIPVWSIHLS